MWASSGYSTISTTGGEGGAIPQQSAVGIKKYGLLLLAMATGCLLGVVIGLNSSFSIPANPDGANTAMLVGVKSMADESENLQYSRRCNPAEEPLSTYALGEMDISTSLELNPSHEVLSQIGKADKEILMCVYKLSDQEIVEALVDAIRRGVDVKIIADKGAQFEGKGKEYLMQLAEVGAHVRIWGKHKGYNKLHAKFSVFDSKLGLAGSNNGSKGAGRRNLELLLRFDMEPAVHQLKKKFSELFELGHRLHPN